MQILPTHKLKNGWREMSSAPKDKQILVRYGNHFAVVLWNIDSWVNVPARVRLSEKYMACWNEIPQGWVTYEEPTQIKE